MDLIEQLGGYDVAKEKYQSLSDSDVITIGPFEVPAKPYFKDELLEYRRRHNIFEVGDKVIKTHPKNTILWPVLGVYKNGGVWLDYKGFCWKPPSVRHATDAEIKVNRRLNT